MKKLKDAFEKEMERFKKVGDDLANKKYEIKKKKSQLIAGSMLEGHIFKKKITHNLINTIFISNLLKFLYTYFNKIVL